MRTRVQIVLVLLPAMAVAWLLLAPFFAVPAVWDGLDLADVPSNETGPLHGAALARRPRTASGGGDRSLSLDPHERLRSLLGEARIDWGAVASALAEIEGPVGEDVRRVLADALRTRPREEVLVACSAVRDAVFATDLLGVLADPAASEASKAGALRALARVPAAAADPVPDRLAGLLTGEVQADHRVLATLAARGGLAAARHVLAYVRASPTPGLVPADVLQSLRVTNHPEMLALVARALGRGDRPDVVLKLLDLTGHAGASALTQPLIALDREDGDEQVRRKALGQLGAIGDAEAVAHLLKRARGGGPIGRDALWALRRLQPTTPEVGSRLVAAWAEIDRYPDPVLAREALLGGLASLGHDEALRAALDSLDDPHPPVQSAALQALGTIGARARSHVRELVALYPRGGHGLQVQVASTLGRVGGPDAAAALRSFLRAGSAPPRLERALRAALQVATRREND